MYVYICIRIYIHTYIHIYHIYIGQDPGAVQGQGRARCEWAHLSKVFHTLTLHLECTGVMTFMCILFRGEWAHRVYPGQLAPMPDGRWTGLFLLLLSLLFSLATCCNARRVLNGLLWLGCYCCYWLLLFIIIILLFYNVIFLSARWVLNRLLTSMIINDYYDDYYYKLHNDNYNRHDSNNNIISHPSSMNDNDYDNKTYR